MVFHRNAADKLLSFEEVAKLFQVRRRLRRNQRNDGVAELHVPSFNDLYDLRLTKALRLSTGGVQQYHEAGNAIERTSIVSRRGSYGRDSFSRCEDQYMTGRTCRGS
jgi:hypothetical protein